MINDVKPSRNITRPISGFKYSKLNLKNIIKNVNASPFNCNKEISLTRNMKKAPSLISINDNRKKLPNSARTRNLENKSIGVNLNPIILKKNIPSINHKKVFLHLSENFSKEKILSPKIKRPQKLIIKNKSFNLDSNILPKLNLKKKNINKNGIYYIGGDLSLNNKYISDLISENSKNSEEKTDMETVDIRIEQLAKDINLFQNERKYRRISINNNSSIKNSISDDEYKNILPIINSDNISNKYSNSQSRISSGNPRSRLYSGKLTNYTELFGSNKYLNKQKISRIISPSLLSDRYNIVGTNVMSPICQRARDIFLYKKIFYYFSSKKAPKIMTKFINNKLNICYAENEKQFQKKLMQINIDNKRRGKAVYHKVGKAETEKKAASLQHRVEFIKKIFDYAYPDILICKIKNKCDMDKREIKENKLKILMKKRELEEKLRIKKYKKSLFHNSMIIKKVD